MQVPTNPRSYSSRCWEGHHGSCHPGCFAWPSEGTKTSLSLCMVSLACKTPCPQDPRGWECRTHPSCRASAPGARRQLQLPHRAVTCRELRRRLCQSLPTCMPQQSALSNETLLSRHLPENQV